MPETLNGGKKGVSAAKGGKAKRKPSKYNLFVKKYMHEHLGNRKVQEVMKEAAAAWRKEKK